MVMSWPATDSSYPATSPASPAPTIKTFFGEAVCGNPCGVRPQLCSGANCAEATARKPSFKKSLRSIGVDIASGNPLFPGSPESYLDRRGMDSRLFGDWEVGFWFARHSPVIRTGEVLDL